jgi:glutamyl-tRNA reductase
MKYSLKAISISHINASVKIREKLSLNEDECRNLHFRIKEVLGVKEALILSTCNRVEVYYVSDQDLNQKLILLLLFEKGINNKAFYEPYFLTYTGQVALRRLFEVSIGLESQVTGDLQIINQVKKAYQVSVNLEMAGPFLHRLMHTIFYTFKRIVQETSFHKGSASVSYTCTALVKECTSKVKDPKVLIVGLGEIGTEVAKRLAKTNIQQIVLANRTNSKAVTLANELQFKAVSMQEIWKEIEKADVVISALQGKQDKPFFSLHQFRKIPIFGKKVLIDLSVPTSIEASINMVSNVVLYNIDELNQHISKSLKTRTNAIPLVQRIISGSLEEFNEWTEEMIFSPAIQKFKRLLEEIKKQEMAKNLKYLNDSERDKVENITNGMIQKLIKLPVLQLKAACKKGEAANLAGILNELFNLEREKIEVFQRK